MPAATPSSILGSWYSYSIHYIIQYMKYVRMDYIIAWVLIYARLFKYHVMGVQKNNLINIQTQEIKSRWPKNGKTEHDDHLPSLSSF